MIYMFHVSVFLLLCCGLVVLTIHAGFSEWIYWLSLLLVAIRSGPQTAEVDITIHGNHLASSHLADCHSFLLSLKKFGGAKRMAKQLHAQKHGHQNDTWCDVDAKGLLCGDSLRVMGVGRNHSSRLRPLIFVAEMSTMNRQDRDNLWHEKPAPVTNFAATFGDTKTF